MSEINFLIMIESLIIASLLAQEPNVSFEHLHKSLTRNIGSHSNSAPIFLAQEIPAIQENGFVFEFLGCETTPNSDMPLTCDVLVENTQDEEKQLDLYAGLNNSNFSRVIDASGNEIFASSATLGKSEGTGYARAFLPSGIPLRASLSFNEVPEGGIRILDIGCYVYGAGGGPFDIEFRFSR